jgi:ferric-dicitrate binding protein FerR (iron transport regulator)
MEKNTLYRFFSNTTTTDEERQILDWIEESPEHEKELLKERRIFDLTIMNTGKTRAIPEIPKRTGIYSIRWIREVVKIAAVALIVLGIDFYFLKDQSNEQPVPLSTISVPAGQRLNLTLPDGTTIWMNALSEIKYPAVFTGNERKVSLKGEAYFDVTHTGTPFFVETGKYTVQVLGTKFNLDANADMNRFCTSLIEGKVRIINHDNPAEEIILDPNEQACINDGKLIKQAIADFDVFKWRDGLFCFKKMSFTMLLEYIENYYDVKIVLEKTSFPQKELSGKIRITDGVEHALRVLQKNIQFDYLKQEGIIYIR